MNEQNNNHLSPIVKLGIPALQLPRPLPADAFICYALTPDKKHLRQWGYDYRRAAAPRLPAVSARTTTANSAARRQTQGRRV
jgi:hypothetical protein